MHGQEKVDVEALVDAIRARKLVEPAILLLEMCKPITGCARELYRATEPVFRSFISPAVGLSLKHVLASAENVELLIRRLEAGATKST
jgi:hypothetical protein